MTSISHQGEMAKSTQQFVEELSQSGLLSANDLESLGELPAAVSELSRTLVEKQKITEFQADHIAKGESVVLGNYVLIDEIGAGGMGKVYLARHRRMKRQVALKMLPARLMQDSEAVGRFQREVETAAQLSHVNIVTAYDADEVDGSHFFVMEYIEGADFSKLVRQRGTLSVGQAVDCVRQVAAGLAYAHSKGIIHRDIKPGNLLLDSEGVVRILDMGLARYQTTSDELTNTGMAMGTVDFMAPEQAINAKDADARSDIYSLGCTLYFLLTGQRLFDGESVFERITAHQKQQTPDLALARKDVPAELNSVFQKMVAKDPGDRFQSADEITKALDCVVADIAMGSDDDAAPLKSLLAPQSIAAAPESELELAKTETRPSIHDPTVEHEPAAVTGQTKSAGKRRAAIAATLIAMAVLVIGLIANSSSSNKREAVRPPDQPASDSTPTQQKLAGQVATPTSPFDRDRQVAEWILAAGGRVGVVSLIDSTREILVGGEDSLPYYPFVIQDLSFMGLEFESSELDTLRGLGRLRWLGFGNSGLDRSGLQVLSQSSSADSLYLSGSKVRTSDLGLLESLRPLYIRLNQELVDDDWRFLAKLTTVREIDVVGEAFRPPSDSKLFGNLVTLSLRNVDGLSPSVVERLQNANPMLRIIAGLDLGKQRILGTDPFLETMQELADKGWVFRGISLNKSSDWSSEKEISELPSHLTHAWLPEDKQLTEQDIATIRSLPRSLLSLELRNRSTVDAIIPAFADLCLEKLLLNDSDLTDVGLLELTNLRNLFRVNVVGTRVSREGVRDFSDKMPYCLVESDYGQFLAGKRKHLALIEATPGTPPPASSSHVWPSDQPAPAIAPFAAEDAKRYQESWAKHLGVPVEMENSIGMKLRVVPAGEFTMGSSKEEIAQLLDERTIEDSVLLQILSEMPQRNAVVAHPFLMSCFEVTCGQFRTFIEDSAYKTDAENNGGGWGLVDNTWARDPKLNWSSNPGYQQSDDHPVANVTWNDAKAFCEWLSKREGWVYRLPSESEWEFACRAGTTGRWSIPDDEVTQLASYAWFGDGDRRTHSVGLKRENPLGLHDMHGNVWEWTSDPLEPSQKVSFLRGGSVRWSDVGVRSAMRCRYQTNSPADNIGFRVVRTFETYQREE